MTGDLQIDLFTTLTGLQENVIVIVTPIVK